MVMWRRKAGCLVLIDDQIQIQLTRALRKFATQSTRDKYVQVVNIEYQIPSLDFAYLSNGAH